jgi:hypothetical protein
MKQTLTARQLKELEIIVNDSARLTLSHTPPDRAGAESAINYLYKKVGLAPPKKIIWGGSPFAVAISDMSRAIGVSDEDALRTALDMQGRNVMLSKAAWKSAEIISEKIEGEVFGYSAIVPLRALRGAASRHLWHAIEEFWTIRDHFLPAVDGKREQRFKRAISRLGGPSIASYLDDAICTPYESGMYSFYSYLCGITGAPQLKELMDVFLQLAGCGGWVIPYESLCLVSDKPLRMECNPTGDLHSLTGSALEFADGFAVHAVDGIVVPDFIVEEPQRITTRMIDNERNAALRRIMISRYQGNFFDDCGAQLEAEDTLGRLYRKKRNGFHLYPREELDARGRRQLSRIRAARATRPAYADRGHRLDLRHDARTVPENAKDDVNGDRHGHR